MRPQETLNKSITDAMLARTQTIGSVHNNLKDNIIFVLVKQSYLLNNLGVLMKIEPQNSPELNKLSELIADISVAMLTLDSGNGLVSHPMRLLEIDDQGALWFFTDVRTGRVGHLSVANLSFSDESRGIYVSISGYGEVEKDAEHIERLWTPLARPWFPDGPQSPNLTLLKFTPNAAEYWDAPRSKMMRMFGLAISVVAGEPIGLGEHDTLTDLTKLSQDAATLNTNPSDTF